MKSFIEFITEMAVYKGQYPTKIKTVASQKDAKGSVMVRLNNGESHIIHAKDTKGRMPRPGEDIKMYMKESDEIEDLVENFDQLTEEELVKISEVTGIPLEELSGKTLGSYIQKSHSDIQKRKDYAKKLDSDPKVQVAKEKQRQAWATREYDKNGKATKRVQSARNKAEKMVRDRKTKLDPDYVKNTSTYNRHKGIDRAIARLTYNKLTKD